MKYKVQSLLLMDRVFTLHTTNDGISGRGDEKAHLALMRKRERELKVDQKQFVPSRLFLWPQEMH